MATLLGLIERVGEATGSDRKLDAEIHALLFGTVNSPPVGVTFRDPFDPARGHAGPFHFTGHVEGAEQALPGPEWPEYQITRRYGTGYHASIGTGRDGVGFETAALALLDAALRARAFPQAEALAA